MSPLTRMDLVGPYKDYFKVTLADNDQLRDEVFRLRFNVYCRELGWENPREFADRLEHDVYDTHSRHCLLLHHRSGLYAGTVRLVTSAINRRDPPIPMLRQCGDRLFDGPLRPDRLPIGSYGEMSRLALRSEFRRRSGEQLDPGGQGTELFEWSQDERRQFPHIALTLYLAGAAMGLGSELCGVYAMLETRLARHLRYAGLHFEAVGDSVEFRGHRAPYYITRESLIQHLRKPLRDLLAAIADDMHIQVAI